MRKYLFMLVLFLAFKASAQDLDDSLSKYSYLIEINQKCVRSQATGFFVRYQQRLFFITAAHCITGWDPFSFKPIKDFPDTVFIRMSNDTSKVNYLPLPVADIKRTAKPFREYESPDVYVVEIKDPRKYAVYSIEGFFDESIQCDLAHKVYVSGYPGAPGYNDYLRARQQPKTAESTLSASYCIYSFRSDAKKYDPVNYFTSFEDHTSQPGLSGAPTYLLTDDNALVFGGIYIGGPEKTLNTGMVVRPEYVIAEVRSKIAHETMAKR